MQVRRKILVTGANGLLGRHTVAALQHKHQVCAVVRETLDIDKKLDNVVYYPIDFATNWTLRDLPDAVDVIVHLAQSIHFREFPGKTTNIFKVNIESTARLLDYALHANAKRFIYASSGGIYGKGSIKFHENSSIAQHQNLGYYLGSKLCGETLAQSYSSLVDVTILRPFFMYGLRQRRSMLIPRLIDSVRLGRPITLQGEEGIQINPVHVKDAVSVIEKCLSLSGSQTLNVAGSDILSIKEISKLIAKLTGKKVCFEKADGAAQDLIGDNELMRALLNKDLISLENGLLEMVQGQP